MQEFNVSGSGRGRILACALPPLPDELRHFYLSTHSARICGNVLFFIIFQKKLFAFAFKKSDRFGNFGFLVSFPIDRKFRTSPSWHFTLLQRSSSFFLFWYVISFVDSLSLFFSITVSVQKGIIGQDWLILS